MSLVQTATTAVTVIGVVTVVTVIAAATVRLRGTVITIKLVEIA